MLKSIRVTVLVGLIAGAQWVGAESRSQFDVKQIQELDLIHEKAAVSIMDEPTVQKTKGKGTRQLKFGVGYWQPGFVELLSGSDFVTRYNLSHGIIQPQFALRNYITGNSLDFGWDFEVGYSRTEGHVGVVKTQLHIIPVYTGGVLRWRPQAEGKWSLLVGLGPMSIISAQWGPSLYTTTDSEWVARASIGLDFNLGSTYILGVSGQQVFAERDSESDWNGRSYMATLGVVL